MSNDQCCLIKKQAALGSKKHSIIRAMQAVTRRSSFIDSRNAILLLGRKLEKCPPKLFHVSNFTKHSRRLMAFQLQLKMK